MIRCTDGAASEQLAGTATVARQWWLFEVPGSWGSDAVTTCRIPAISALTSSPDRRVLLVRRPGRHPASDSPVRMWVVDATNPGSVPLGATLPDPGVILDDLARIALTPDPDAPILAVCTNARRDLCCGIDGRALVAAIGEHPGLWECTHLGGHRFAATAIQVRRSMIYGRLTHDAALELLTAPGDARLDLARGRTCLDPPAQAAELALLNAGIPAVSSSARVVHASDDRCSVTFATTEGSFHAVGMHRVPGQPRPASCDAEPEPYADWQVETISKTSD